MVRLDSLLALSLSLGSTVAHKDTGEWDQEGMNRDSNCDNDCFFGSFPGGSCTDDAACMCTQQKYRERYFCCMAEKCDPHVLFDSIQRQSLGCEAHGKPYPEFDYEAVCGITLTTATSTTQTSTASSTDATTTKGSSADTTAGSTVTVTVTGGASSSSDEPSSSSKPTSGASALGASPMFHGVGGLLVAIGLLAW